MKHALRAALAALILLGNGAYAADGLYLGAGIGLAAVRDDVDAETLDEDDAAYKAFIGWRWDSVPVVDLAIEAGYTDFGKQSQILSGRNVQYQLTGASVAGLLIVPLGPLDFYGKAGLLSWSSDLTNGATTTGRSGSDPFYGVGFGFYFWKIGFRAEYEQFQIKDVERVEMVSLSALFQF
jgi:outer membrane immunogenic protein